jgi:hypothetical protein
MTDAFGFNAREICPAPVLSFTRKRMTKIDATPVTLARLLASNLHLLNSRSHKGTRRNRSRAGTRRSHCQVDRNRLVAEAERNRMGGSKHKRAVEDKSRTPVDNRHKALDTHYANSVGTADANSQLSPSSFRQSDS